MRLLPLPDAADDVDVQLLGVLARLAAEFEGDVGITPIRDEVQRARDRLRLERVDEADHMDRVESIAHDALVELRADEGRLSATRFSARSATPRTARYNVGSAAAIQYALMVSLVSAVVVGAVGVIGFKINFTFAWVLAALSRVG